MSEDNVFDEATETKEADSKKQDDSVLEAKIEELKGTPNDELAKSKAHADHFIEFLKEQNADLKGELDKRLTAEATLDAIKDRQDQEPKVSEEPTSSGLNPEDVKNLVKDTIDQTNEEAVQSKNVATVDTKLKEIYGDKAQEFVDNKAKELGLSKTELGQMAARSPSAFLNAVGVGEKNQVSDVPISKSTVNPENLVNESSVAQPGTHWYYRELRQSNPGKFYSPKVQQQLFKDRERLGDDYYNR